MEQNPRIRLFPLRALVGDIQPTICSFLEFGQSSRAEADKEIDYKQDNRRRKKQPAHGFLSSDGTRQGD
jgi:hypothetical protein